MSLLETAGAASAALGAAAIAGPGEPRSLAMTIAQRATFGATPQDVALAGGMGWEAYVRYQLSPSEIPDPVVDGILATAAYNTLTFTPDQFVGQSTSNVANQLIRATLIRAVYSTRQLYERLVEFWSDHFNIWLQQDGVTLLKTVDDRDVIRANAVGNFGTMLRASAHSPAMLSYLDNNTNRLGAPNENYARELMELHTLGVDGGYTQSDVKEVARCFTGWSYYGGSSGVQSYTFRYISGQHDTGQKVVLGQVIPSRPASQGMQDGEDVLNILLAHPSTARFIARKLLTRFWGEGPPQQMIDLVAQTFQATGGDIKSMVRVVFGFIAASPPPPRFKRPMHLLVSALRCLGAVVNSPGSLVTPLTLAGHVPFGWSPPDGYPDTLAYWVGGMLPRWNFGAALMNNEYSQVTVDIAAFLAGATTPQQIVDRIDAAMFGKRLPAAEKSQLLSYLGVTPTTTTRRETVGLAVATPAFQWY